MTSETTYVSERGGTDKTVEAGWTPTAEQIDCSRVGDFARWLGD